MSCVPVINPDEIAKALGVVWNHPQEEDCYTGRVIVHSKSFVWLLREHPNDLELMTLHYYANDLDWLETIELHIESGGYESTIVFGGVQEVEYFPQYRCVEFKRWRGEFPDKLKVWWRGQFDLYLS